MTARSFKPNTNQLITVSMTDGKNAGRTILVLDIEHVVVWLDEHRVRIELPGLEGVGIVLGNPKCN